VGILNSIGHEFWCETFSGKYPSEILFWIEYPGRRLSIQDLELIGDEFEDLFYIGLKRQDLDLEDVEEVIENLKEDIERLEEAENGDVIQQPDTYEGLKGKFLEVDEFGITGSSYLGEGTPGGNTKVIRSDESMERVDFTKQKEILRKRLAAINGLM
jgi:hypothetical protein